MEDLQDKIDEVDERLDTALGNIDQAFKDQIISEAEKRIIEKTLETLAEQHAEMEDLYNKYKDHENLTDETKTTLKNKWTPYNSGYVDLVAYINEIIADDKCTETEVNSYKTKVEEYNARYIDIKEIINSLDRTRAGMTAPPEGLFLKKVFYESKV